MKIAVKEVGKDLKIIEVQERYRDECVRKYTGEKEFAEYVRLNENGTLCMGVNEDGNCLGLPHNFLLDTKSPYFPVQKIVGTAVFVRHKYVDILKEEIWDFEIEDLESDDLKLIQKILDAKYQDELKGKLLLR